MSRETAFGIPNAESYTGSVGRLDFYDPGGAGRFYAILNFEVFDMAALIANPNGIQIDVIDGANSAAMIGYAADAYRVTSWRALLLDLTDNNVDNFADMGLPFPAGDFTAAANGTPRSGRAFRNRSWPSSAATPRFSPPR